MQRLFYASSLSLLALSAFGGAFAPGDLVVVQVGTGGAALSSAATAAFLNEYTLSGGFVQQIALPTAASGPNNILTLSGTATSEGFLTLSADRQYMTIGGYNAAAGTAGVNSSVGNRTVARVDRFGNVDTTTVLNDAASIGNIRSVASSDGSAFWVSSSSGGMRYASLGGTSASTQLNTAAPVNLRVANIYGGQLYVSSASGTFFGVGTLGSGLPTTAGQTPALLNGFPTATGPSPYDFLFADANTLYVADDRTVATGGGIQKWKFDGTTWSLTYTLNSGLTAGVRGLTGYTDEAGNQLLFATTADSVTASAGNKLVSITDQISATTASGSFSLLATAPGNTAFRGVEFAVIPEPSSFALGGLGIAMLLIFRRRK